MKSKLVFACQQCGQQYSKWVGRCQECGEWNTVVEERVVSKENSHPTGLSTPHEKPHPLSGIDPHELPRIPSNISELDSVLGGGLVPGSVVLVGGEPGIGKSTLLLQAAAHYAKSMKRILYVSGEESKAQIALRAERLGVISEQILLATETSLEAIENHIAEIEPNLLIVDSVQTLHCSDLDSQMGSVSQLRECAFRLVSLAKARRMGTFLVGHITKEGSIAGPKILEHMVDTVLYFETNTTQTLRILRSIKNRFGSTQESGLFEMAENGLRSVSNPSELLLAERPHNTTGSVVVATHEGNRPILVEVQALVTRSELAIPRRTAIGLDPYRVSLLVAILEKRGGYRLHDQDVYVNVAGGLRIVEPACDLGVVAALISNVLGKPAIERALFFGEVGLGGEVRAVPKAPRRLKEASRLGFTMAFIPKKCRSDINGSPSIEIIGVEHVQELSDRF